MCVSKPKLEDCSEWLTGLDLGNIILGYFPEELCEEVQNIWQLTCTAYVMNDGKEIIQMLIDKSDHKFRMYLGAEYLAEEFKKFRSFTSSHKFLQMGLMNPYTTAVKLYPSLTSKNANFIVKQDLFVQIQGIIFARYPNMKIPLRSILCVYLKTLEKRLSKCHEFVKYEKKIFDEIERKIDKTMERMKMEDPSKLVNYHLLKFVEKWMELVPGWAPEELELMGRLIKPILEGHPLEENRELLMEVWYDANCLFEVIQEIMEEHLDMFRPYSEGKTSLITVRVFNCRGHNFVMKSELYMALNRVFPEKKLKYKDPEGFLMAMELDDVHKEFGDLENKIHIVIDNLPMTSDKKAVPIMTPDGDYCTLAADALLEIIIRSIVHRKLFQKIQEKHLPEFMRILRPFFTENMKSRYFVKMSSLEKVEKKLDVFCKKFDKIPAKSVRNAKKDGFTLENLKNEMIHLGLTDIFPMIQLMAQANYEDLIQKFKPNELNTWHLFYAIEKSQIDCLMQKCPEIYRFLHTQKEPHLMCELCENPFAQLFASMLRIGSVRM